MAKTQYLRYTKNNKVYGYSKRKPARKGVLAMWLFGIAVADIAALIALSAARGGTVSATAGAVGVVGAVLCVYGILLARESFHEPDRSYRVSRIAIALNAALLVILALIFIIGIAG